MWLPKYLKSPVSQHPLAVNLLTGTKHCWNLGGSTFILFFHHYEISWVRKKFLLLIYETLGHFVNRFIADDKYLLHKKKNFPQSLQTHLSKKVSNFSEFLIAYLDTTILNDFKKKLHHIAWVFPKLLTSKDVVF